MGYGRGEYGQRGYGGSSFEDGGPALGATDPLNGATLVDPFVVITFAISSPAGLDEFSLDVDLDGLQAIVGGVFQTGYGGTIVYDPETNATVVISTHPELAGGATPVDIDVTDLAGNPATLGFSFDTDLSVSVPEAVTVTEGLDISQAFVASPAESVTVSEGPVASKGTEVVLQQEVTILEGFESGSLLIEALDASTIRVAFPQELRFDGIRELANFDVSPTLGSTGADVNLVKVSPIFDTFESGSSAQLVDLGFAAHISFGSPPNFKGQAGTSSNVMDFHGTADFTLDDVGDYIEVLNGHSAGLYQIIDRYITNEAVDTGAPVKLPRIVLDRPLSVRDPINGYIEGLAEVLDVVADGELSYVVTLRLNHSSITALDPLLEVLFVEDRTDLEKVREPTIAIQGLVTFLDHNTFTIKTSGGFTPTLDSIDHRFFVTARISPKLQWRHISGVQELIFKTNRSPGTKLTQLQPYRFTGKNLLTKNTRANFFFNATFITLPGVVDLPRVISATFLPFDGTVLVEFDQEMRVEDETLANPIDYTITGPSPVSIKRARLYNASTVALETSGLTAGDYTLTVSTSTPKDVAGNPIDPVFNSVIFTSAIPETTRSVFTDKGPIAKPPLTLQTGTAATLDSYNEITLPGAALTANEVGKYVTLSGGSINGGTFRISAMLSATRARLANASFTFPDASSGSLAWEVFDPRNGEIADDPSDVVVRINGSPVTPEAVIGLLGQIVLNAAPIESDSVDIDYSWCCNPSVEMRRLNSREFRLNSWNRDVGYPQDASQHKYRYNNVLITPGVYEASNPSAKLKQPLSRELHYRAYERAYTPVLNDPTLLLLNNPIHKIAFPPAVRIISESFVTYEGIGLPESQVVNGWERFGGGVATSTSGILTVEDDSTGTYPTGQPIYWTRPIDLTFDHVFAMSWRFSLNTVVDFEGVFTGVAAGYSDENVAVVIGYLEESGVKKFGVLKRGFGDDPSTATAWTGGIDVVDLPTGVAADLDWTELHSFRIFRDQNGTISIFLDGDVDPTLRVLATDLPFLEEVNAAFDNIQGAFFGSLSRPARSSSTWDFVRYLIQPTNPRQSSPSSFVSYEANLVPEAEAKPWTPVGFHGSTTILSTDFLLLDATSATDTATADDVGLVGGDYRGYVRFEPLLSRASEFVVDADIQLITQTHGISAYGTTFAVDDGTRLMQVALFPDQSTPKLSYGGRSLPEDFSPYTWTTLGGAGAAMAGRILRINDTDTLDGKVYFIEDTEPVGDTRVIASSVDYILECRLKVNSYTVDGSGFAGAFTQAFDGTRSVGLLLEEVGGVKRVAFHADGATLTSVVFDWDDSAFHTYRLSKNTSGNLVSLFIDGAFVGSEPYSNFAAPPPNPIGQVSFGSSTPASVAALSSVDWAYCNAWRVRSDLKHYVGLWKGTDADSLLGYHLPLKAAGRGASVTGNVLNDGNADFVTASIAAGDALVVDTGLNRGVYEVAGVGGSNILTIVGTWPAAPSLVDYRIIRQVDWTSRHKYRLARDPQGEVALYLDTEPLPLVRVSYSAISLPASGTGIVRTLGDGLPAIAWGSFDAENLAQSSWDFVRYGITLAPTEQRIAPHHQNLNQWNVMHSPERLFTPLAHTLTDFKSSSTGQPPKTDPDFLASAGLTAFTILNEGTPLVPSTQSFEVRSPFPIQEFISALNRPEDVLNNDGDFTLNDSGLRFRLLVPNDVLYSCLDVIEQLDDGTTSLITPFDDWDCSPNISGLNYNSEVCLNYDGAVLPESVAVSPTPWELVSDTPGDVSTSAFSGVLTYSTAGSKTVYRNNSPLPDAPSLQTEARFRIRLLNDATAGTGDSQVRFGMSAPGMTIALAFLTTPLGERFVLILDLNNGNILGSSTFDFLDGAFHDYRIVRDPSAGTVQVFIDS